jgi:hypothetical protein
MLFMMYVTSQRVRSDSTAFQIVTIAVLHKTFSNQLSVMLNMFHSLHILDIHDTLEVSSVPVFTLSVVMILTAMLLHCYCNISGNGR